MGFPHRLPTEVMMIMMTLMANQKLPHGTPHHPKCLQGFQHTSVGAIAAKSGTCSTNNPSYLPLLILWEIPTRIFQKDSSDVIIDLPIDDNDCCPNQTCKHSSTTMDGNHALPSPPKCLCHDNNSYRNELQLQAIATACNQVKQCVRAL